jgi:hypothetical protein
VEVDTATKARCYFDRPSAPVPEKPEEALERSQIMEDMKAMKKLAVDYLHPELPVTVTDPFACGRNYFTRPSASVTEETEEAMERNQILEDMKATKKLAVDYLHPELPVATTDPYACGRNYFTRPSAKPYDLSSKDHGAEEEERHVILEELHWMKTLANGFMHPEIPIDYSGLEEDGHFDMDEDITTSYTYQYHRSMNVDHAEPDVSGKAREENLAFSPDCVMMMK